MKSYPKILSKNFEVPHAQHIGVYLSGGGYEAARKVYTSWKPEQLIEEVKKSNLRGLGGAGFSTGMKWAFIPKDSTRPHYVVVNADEGEPGTFKDRYILCKDPHALVEGILIACFAVGSHKAFVYIRGEYVEPIRIFREAVREAHEKGFLGKNVFGTGYEVEIVIHQGAGAYICGEETALLESLEGKKGFPRLKPPFPAVKGVFGCPTVINNVETLACLPPIVNLGAEWFAKLGCEKNGGTRLYSVSGHVNRPGLYELPLGTPLREIIEEHAGGVWKGRQLKAVIPGGISASILRSDEVDIKMDFNSLARVGSMLGSAGVVVMDETTCMVTTLLVAARFFAHESCGQCSPCREGTGWVLKMIERIYEGHGRSQDLDNLLDIGKNMMGNTICAFGDAAPTPVISYITKFRAEFEYHVRHGKCDLEDRSQKSE
ncbi:MAG: NADH-quinone oxidoreductase subunit NuoF [Chlamydiae bacterium]|nr:NADH-quinone oxidoreductase subunit NuoF [Chlamydiota bacterium]MBI3267350.1 NADH-quinone oxidoreductase subunit NuoF [Chlamydiota bacterium]